MVVAATVLVPDVVNVLPAATVIEVTVGAMLTFSVTVKPPSIVTTLPLPGTDAPGAPPEEADQVAVLFQGPVETEKRFCPFALNHIVAIKTKVKITPLWDLFFLKTAVKNVFKL
jgi:hypothetical protein